MLFACGGVQVFVRPGHVVTNEATAAKTSPRDVPSTAREGAELGAG